MITFIHQRELNAVLEDFPCYVEQFADQQELAALHRTWIPLLSTYVTHDSVETAIDEWYAMIKCSSLWFHYIEKQALKTERPLVIEIFSSWKRPFVFAGRQEKSGWYTNWADQALWEMKTKAGNAFIGMALPTGSEPSAHIVHYFQVNQAFFPLLEKQFEESSFSSKQLFLNERYLSCLALISDTL